MHKYTVHRGFPSMHKVSSECDSGIFLICFSFSVLIDAVMEKEGKFLQLPDGRKISYREQGLPKQSATRSLLVLHGLGSSRLASMPGVSEDLLKEMGVRLIAIDRPGYGLSTPNPQQSFSTAAADIANIADILELGERIWLLGYSCGGAYCWGAARYIPERIAGIAMWAPAGNYWWKDFTDTQRKAAMAEITIGSRLMFLLVRQVPQWMVYAYVRHVVVRTVGARWVASAKKQLSPPDQHNLAANGSSGLMFRDSIESAKQDGFGMAQDLQLLTGDWGFGLSDVQRVYHGPLHIWQGDQDWLVPISLQRLIKKRIPDLVHLHELLGEGHLSPFCFNDKVHRDTLSVMFSKTRDSNEVSLTNVNKALENTPQIKTWTKRRLGRNCQGRAPHQHSAGDST
ncbi:uncharacterized protein [Physcomitrium patens]|uniref:AB hydrolase-1 domain-containing protein n=1 Tax=Physcomitrium patens TaxID=3218 RepID=A0A2K1JS80_PHYPA|nr:uncharacterized protein LOC112289740 isoform X1 [Physcomitrium patens]PNR44395.1 hypothetical protein PHYPA_016779 [Physcomitrium patens]|eukprot:XP_024391006.1 uncharacterized protein LOC112289740 isoform X1 [Physcomitrella patens]